MVAMVMTGDSWCWLRSPGHIHYTVVHMRWHAVASVVTTAFLTAIIAAIPSAGAFAQATAPTPPEEAPREAPSLLPEAAPDGPAAPPSEAGQADPPPRPAIVARPRFIEVPDAASPSPVRMVASLSHDLQFGLAVMLGDGYRGIFPYESTIDCGDARSNDNRVCTSRSPVFLDLQPSFGLNDHWDFLVDLRFGLTRDFNTYHQFFAMPGFRYWLDPQSQVKFFTSLQLAYDRSNQNNRPGAPHYVSNNDLGFRNSNGFMVEVMRNLGIYVQFGETVGFYRWLSISVDAGLGVQARVP